MLDAQRKIEVHNQDNYVKEKCFALRGRKRKREETILATMPSESYFNDPNNRLFFVFLNIGEQANGFV